MAYFNCAGAATSSQTIEEDTQQVDLMIARYP